MAAAHPAKLRLFDGLEGPQQLQKKSAVAPPPTASGRGCSSTYLFRAGASLQPLPVTALLLEAAAGSAAPQRGEDDDGLAAALRDQLVPAWRYWGYVNPYLASQYRSFVESPCVGVPGICTYLAARATWLKQQLQLSIDGDNCLQVVLLRPGYSSWAHKLGEQTGVTFFEIESKEIIERKRQLVAAALQARAQATQQQQQQQAAGGREPQRAPRPPLVRYVPLDWAGNLKSLVTALTAAGFDPAARCCLVAEGCLQHLSQEQVDSLISDLSALCAPGSRLLLDFLHADALQGGGAAAEAQLPGFANLAASVANKGSPLRSSLPPAFSALVRYFQPHHFRLTDLLPPPEVARLHLASQAQTAGGRAAAAGAQALPHVPPFFSLAGLVKANPRLLLRDAPLAAATAGDQDGLSSWTAAAALSSPSCFFRSLGWLVWGAPSQTPAPAAAGAMQPAGLLSAPPAGAAEGAALGLPPARWRSAEWSLPAAPSSSSAGPAGMAPAAAAAAAAEVHRSPPAPPRATSLDRAQSIVAAEASAALEASSQAAGSGAAANSNSSSSSGGQGDGGAVQGLQS